MLQTPLVPGSLKRWLGRAAMPPALFSLNMLTRVAVLRDPGISSGIGQFAIIEAVATPLGVEVSAINFGGRSRDRARHHPTTDIGRLGLPVLS